MVKRFNPGRSHKRLANLLTAWQCGIKEMTGGMGIDSIESRKGNRLMLRAWGAMKRGSKS